MKGKYEYLGTLLSSDLDSSANHELANLPVTASGSEHSTKSVKFLKAELRDYAKTPPHISLTSNSSSSVQNLLDCSTLLSSHPLERLTSEIPILPGLNNQNLRFKQLKPQFPMKSLKSNLNIFMHTKTSQPFSCFKSGSVFN